METEREPIIPEDPSKNFYKYYRFKLGRDTPSDARNTILVVAVLIVALTFQAAVNPPGGVWQDTEQKGNITKVAGKAVLGSAKSSYITFVFANTLAFSSASQAILYLVLDCPFQTEILIAIYATNFSYGA
ncbi:hypothetical protein Tsubulata_003014 [Turnera subulata]|uniref:PGG domain-containing protein n=1 Tax=Turnera subulata TaxID=218843 RepID=A0A9Q0G1B6_9ROSI|nr:hypothetical protein Tsubulata_003014 [Turnera subulata]